MLRAPSSGKSHKKEPAPRTVQSVDRALGLVDALSRASGGRSLAELARALGLPPQTAQSLLRTLQHHGWVTQGGRGEPYRLGPALGVAQRRWLAGQDRAALAGPIVSEFGRRVGEYAVLAEWRQGRLAPLVETHPDRELSVRGESFAPDRLHTMATGKLLLAYRDEPERNGLARGLPLARRGPRSVTDAGRLIEQLASIRRKGLAICREEAARGIAAIAVPICEADGSVRTALGVSLPMARYSAARRTGLVAALRRAADDIARVWG